MNDGFNLEYMSCSKSDLFCRRTYYFCKSVKKHRYLLFISITTQVFTSQTVFNLCISHLIYVWQNIFYTGKVCLLSCFYLKWLQKDRADWWDKHSLCWIYCRTMNKDITSHKRWSAEGLRNMSSREDRGDEIHRQIKISI